MPRASSLLPLALALVACRERHITTSSTDAQSTAVDRASTAPSPTPPPAPSPPAAAWCWRARPLADVRAIDTHGVVWSVRGTRLTDESRDVTVTLPDEIPCQEGHRWAMEFARDGAAFLVADSRFYVRPSERGQWAVTPLCSDVDGAPWSRRAAGGWSFVSHRSATVEPTLMLTRIPAADMGWFAITGLDATTTSVVLDTSDSFLTLSQGSHLVFVDRVNTVAGAVIAAQSDRFDGLTRTAAGLVAWRDDGERRVMVYSESPAGPFTRVEGRRPPGAPARAVMRVDLARFVAVSDTSVQLSTDRGARFETVLSLPARDGGAELAHPSIGWLAGHHLAVATTGGIASETCPE